MFSPDILVGKSVRSLYDKGYGHKILSYDFNNNQYTVETIYWDSGEAVNPDYLPSKISLDSLYNKYDVNF